MTNHIAECWRRIDEHLSRESPKSLDTLSPGATYEQIAELEGALRRRLPDDVKASLRIHNGQNNPTGLFVVTNVGTLMSAEIILSTWRMLNEVLDQIRVENPNWDMSNWWDPRYIPIAGDDGDYLCIDACDEGRGEIVKHNHDGQLEINAFCNYSEWLNSVLRVFDEARFRIDDEGRIDFWYDIDLAKWRGQSTW